MKLKFKNTPEQVELIKAMGSKRPEVSREASEAFAAFIGPVIQQVLSQADTASAVYSDVVYDEDDNPSYPLDLFFEQRNADNYISVVQQNIAGGLPSSQIAGANELKVATYRLDAAVSFLKKYARRGRLDVVSKAVERMAQEVLVKQERDAWVVILKGLSGVSSKCLLIQFLSFGPRHKGRGQSQDQATPPSHGIRRDKSKDAWRPHA